ncbi:hypothetical protein ABQZ99_013695 [Xanthomonas hortorum pv. vitians]|uniref:hypothetical protein n=1 Tax=Xanthomonas hortorum TaxID=56454 RepID=UPI0015D60E94|nr:hypothetical protein [Xanthomonas hortorum]MCE4344088.1 hypothetical protein [Xanthomonas hortorum pv. vitians]NMI20221.1 hypothetical protein [Xanthomonas hortorum pv. vitians]
MKKQLERTQSRLHRGRIKAFVSRVAWLDVEHRLRRLFNEAQGFECGELGSIYLSSQRDVPALKSAYADSVLNTVWIIIGGRSLNVDYLDKDQRRMLLSEDGGQLWFSQDATGSITVFMSPYKSKHMRMNENELILARYGCATSLTERKLRKHFKTFFRYLAVTSCHGDLGIRGYLFRVRLRMNDRRFATEWASNAHKVYVPVLLALMGLLATLYTGNRLNWLTKVFG